VFGGSHVWSDGFGVNIQSWSAAADANGDVLVTGTFTAAVDFGGGELTTSGSSDIFVGKFSGLDGSHIWSKRFGDVGFDRGLAISVDGTDDIVITGSFLGTINFGGGDIDSIGDWDIFLAKFSGFDGSHIWSKGFGDPGAGQSFGTAVAVDNSDDVVMTGRLWGSVDFGGGSKISKFHIPNWGCL